MTFSKCIRSLFWGYIFKDNEGIPSISVQDEQDMPQNQAYIGSLFISSRHASLDKWSDD